ncbi:MAG: TetR/AcrR family transcriptional regulator [bacterium]|nr:TetR/AcrR family transcriptional regulator [bacterium]
MGVAARVLAPRDQLVAAARRLLDADGLEGIGLRQIARACGVSHGAPLRHFPTLAHLLAAVAAQGFCELHASVGAAVAAAGARATSLARLRAASRGYVRFALANPGVFGLMFRPERFDADDPDLEQAGAAAFGQIVELAAAAQTAGLRPDVAATELAAACWASVHGLAQLWIQGSLQGATHDGARLDTLLDLTQDLLLDGIGAPRTTKKPARRRRTAR